MITLSKPLIFVSCCKNWEHLNVLIVTINLHLNLSKVRFYSLYNYYGVFFSTIAICMKKIFFTSQNLFYIHANTDHISDIVGPFKICKPVM